MRERRETIKSIRSVYIVYYNKLRALSMANCLVGFSLSLSRKLARKVFHHKTSLSNSLIAVVIFISHLMAILWWWCWFSFPWTSPLHQMLSFYLWIAVRAFVCFLLSISEVNLPSWHIFLGQNIAITKGKPWKLRPFVELWCVWTVPNGLQRAEFHLKANKWHNRKTTNAWPQ